MKFISNITLKIKINVNDSEMISEARVDYRNMLKDIR